MYHLSRTASAASWPLSEPCDRRRLRPRQACSRIVPPSELACRPQCVGICFAASAGFRSPTFDARAPLWTHTSRPHPRHQRSRCGCIGGGAYDAATSPRVGPGAVIRARLHAAGRRSRRRSCRRVDSDGAIDRDGRFPSAGDSDAVVDAIASRCAGQRDRAIDRAVP